MLFDKLQQIYADIGWDMVQVPNENILSTTYGGKNRNWTFVVTTDEPNRVMAMFSRLPFSCPPERFDALSQFMEKANFGMSHGAWVMDRSDGEVRFRVGVDMGGVELNVAYVKQLTLYTNMTMEFYLPAMQAIVEDSKSVEEALDITFAS